MLSNTLRSRALTSSSVRVSAVLVALCLLCAFGAVALAGTKTGIALALLVALGPIAAYVALTAPIVFPFALYLVMIPFDNLVAIESFGTLTKLLGIASAAAIAIRLMTSRRHVVPDKAVLSWVPFLLLSLASLAWATDAMSGLSIVLSLLQLFALYVLLAFTPIDRKALGIIVTAIIVGAVIAGTYGAYLFHSGLDTSSEGRVFVNTGSRMIDPNHFAAALILPLGLALTVFVEAKRLSIRFFGLISFALIGLGMLVAGSRGGLVSASFMVAYMIWRSHKRAMIIGLTVAGAGIGLAAFGNIVARFNEIADTGGAGRLGIWRVALVAFSRHPILGAGAGNFSIAYNDAFLSVPAFSAMKIVEAAHFTIAPHNNLVWIGVELGAVGLVAFLYAWWKQFRALRVVPERSDLYPLRVAIEGAIIGQFVCGFFLGTLIYKYLWLAFMLAMIVRNAELDKGGLARENVVSPVLQTAARRS